MENVRIIQLLTTIYMLYEKKYSTTILLHEVGEEWMHRFTMFVPDPGGIECSVSHTSPLPSPSRNLYSTRIQAVTDHTSISPPTVPEVEGLCRGGTTFATSRGVGLGSEICQVVMSCVLSS